MLQQVEEVTILGHHNRVHLAGYLKDLRINRYHGNAQTLPLDPSRQRGRQLAIQPQLHVTCTG